MNQGDLDRYCSENGRPLINLKSYKPKKGILKGYRLDFNYYSESREGGTANVELVEDPTPDDFVEGVLFEINDQDLETIKMKEGCPNCYVDKPLVTIILNDGSKINNVTTFFVKKDKKCGFTPPTRKYLNIIVEGAKTFGLSKEWIEKLERIETLN